MAIEMITDGAMFIMEETKPHYGKPKFTEDDFENPMEYEEHLEKNFDDHYPVRNAFAISVEEEIGKILAELKARNEAT